jgi:AraC-like DNA-binding protein
MPMLTDLRGQARLETVRTWRKVGALGGLRVLREAWPEVLPTLEGGERDRGSDGPRAWQAAISAYDELIQYQDRTTLLRRTVELLRSTIGLERAAIFGLSADGRRLVGTFGTGADGETTDERHIAFEVGSSHREAFAHQRMGGACWSRFAGVPLFAQTARGTVVLRRGENVVIPIPARGGCFGVLACDWGLTGRRVDTDVLMRAAVTTRILAPLLGTLPAHEASELGQERAGEAAPEMSEVACTPAVASSHPQLERSESGLQPSRRVGEEALALAARAARAITDDPEIDRIILAQQLATTPDHLGRAFKAAFGESLGDYRNRVRTRRFLAVVDAGGGNLLEAAMTAGFGSYAQFHRVFRRILGESPAEYLKAGKSRD